MEKEDDQEWAGEKGNTNSEKCPYGDSLLFKKKK